MALVFLSFCVLEKLKKYKCKVFVVDNYVSDLLFNYTHIIMISYDYFLYSFCKNKKQPLLNS